MPLATTSNLIYAFQNSDLFARLIIGLLLLLSIQAWTIMIDKWLTVSHARRSSTKFLQQFATCKSALEMLTIMSGHSGPLVEVYKAGVSDLADILGLSQASLDLHLRNKTFPRPLSPYEIDRVRSTLERTVSAKINELEARLGLLGTAVTVSPFLGLLGTVWGVMIAFCGIARTGRPDIGAMAPGISGALLTTVVGLLVAIPSVVGFNAVTSSVRQTITNMDNFVEDFISLLKLEGGD